MVLSVGNVCEIINYLNVLLLPSEFVCIFLILRLCVMACAYVARAAKTTQLMRLEIYKDDACVHSLGMCTDTQSTYIQTHGLRIDSCPDILLQPYQLPVGFSATELCMYSIRMHLAYLLKCPKSNLWWSKLPTFRYLRTCTCTHLCF